MKRGSNHVSGIHMKKRNVSLQADNALRSSDTTGLRAPTR